MHKSSNRLVPITQPITIPATAPPDSDTPLELEQVVVGHVEGLLVPVATTIPVLPPLLDPVLATVDDVVHPKPPSAIVAQIYPVTSDDGNGVGQLPLVLYWNTPHGCVYGYENDEYKAVSTQAAIQY